MPSVKEVGNCYNLANGYIVTLIWSLTIIGKFLVKPSHNSHCFACIECVMKEHVDN